MDKQEMNTKFLKMIERTFIKNFIKEIYIMNKQEMKDIVYPLTAEEFNQPQKVTSQEVWDVINEADVEVE